MIRDLSETLRAILDDPALAGEFPELAAAQIVFEHPTEQFNPQQTTIDLFLYDLRENMELRSNEPVIERNNGTAIIHRAPLRVACSYLITAWPVGLGDVACYPRLTDELLRRGYSEADVHKVLGGNVLRAFRAAGRVAEELRRTTPPEVDPPPRRGGPP